MYYRKHLSKIEACHLTATGSLEDEKSNYFETNSFSLMIFLLL